MSADYRGFFQKQEEISKRCNDLDKEIFRLNNQRKIKGSRCVPDQLSVGRVRADTTCGSGTEE